MSSADVLVATGSRGGVGRARSAMSDPVGMIEHMFEQGPMETTIERERTTTAPARVDHVGAAKAALERITTLRSRISDMQETRVDTGALPTAAALAPLLPGGAIRSGASYSVPESVLLAMTMLQGASQSGAWCAVVGVPSFGIEAAAAMGIDLERLVLVPDPGDQWLAVTAAMADVATIVLTRPLGRLTPGDGARLSARLRQRGAALVALGSWPGAEATLRVTESSWHGIGLGHGHLSERHATVVASSRAGAGRPASTELLLPAADGSVQPLQRGAGAVPVRPGSVLTGAARPGSEPAGTGLTGSVLTGSGLSGAGGAQPVLVPVAS